MRVKTNTFHFNVAFGTIKKQRLDLESFLQRTYRCSFFGLLGDIVFAGRYKIMNRKKVRAYLLKLRKELKKTPSGTANDYFRFGIYWCNEILGYYETHVGEDIIQNDLKQFWKTLKKNGQSISFKEFKKKSDSYFDYLYEQYDFSDSWRGKKYTDKYFEVSDEYLIKNYEINMKHFESLDSTEFNATINGFLTHYYEFSETNDLSRVFTGYGYYVLVLDEYKQVYIGFASDIKNRILQHWKRIIPYDRRIFGTYKTSKISIDSFGAYDTTRIFVAKSKDLMHRGFYNIENTLIDYFPNKFVTNRVNGGELPSGLLSAERKNISD